MTTPAQVIADMLGKANDAAELRASLRELNSTLVDMLDRMEQRKEPDVAGALLAAMQSLKLPAPVVNVPALQQAPIQVNPQLVTPPGAQWQVEAERTPKGFRMIVTKL